jgi:diaminohydroxyphosphoribosylaminopyrimidine deaminase/5-amino-6-(5-phosphoribosylamino)uracil reductase
MSENNSEYFIKRTFKLAKKGSGYVSPNPMVGAVLVKNGNIIGEGYHQKFGEAHAEVNAIESATESVVGSTLYCNLEPCCHLNKKTPPCAQRIIKEGIKKVVICNLDPNPDVNGKGVQIIREAGLEIETGVLEVEGVKLNRFFFKYIKINMPFVTVKIAQTLDGKISEIKGEQSWVTGKESVNLVHKWRSEYDSVLVGAGTVLIDNPQLTVRDVDGRNPYRIILDGKLKISPELKVFNLENPEKTIIVTTKIAKKKKIREFENMGIRVISINTTNDRIYLKNILTEIVKIGISSVLVEGGSHIFSQFISENIFDELKIFISPKFFIKGLPAVNLFTGKYLNLNLTNSEKIGGDLLLTYLPK